jgi:hypothetical protein
LIKNTKKAISSFESFYKSIKKCKNVFKIMKMFYDKHIRILSRIASELIKMASSQIFIIRDKEDLLKNKCKN